MATLKFFKKATAPTTIAEGNVWFDTTTHSIKIKTATGYDVFGVGLKDAQLVNSVLTITRQDNTTVTVDFSDIASASSVVTALDKKVDKVDGKGLSTNDYTTVDKTKLAGVEAGAQVNVIESIAVNGTALTVTDKAVDITIPAATVTGVDADDKILSLSGKLVKSEVGLTYNSTDKKINLTGKGGTVIASVDATAFIKDGMLDSAELTVNPAGQPAGTYLVLTFNTDSGSEPIYVDVTSLIDVYTAGNGITITGKSIAIDNAVINSLISTKIETLAKEDTAVAGQVVSAVSETDGVITVSRRALVASDIPTISVAKLSDLDATKVSLSTSYTTATTYAAPAAEDTVEVAIGKLAKGVADAQAGGVQSVGGQVGAITVDTAATANGSVKFAMSGKNITGTVNGLKSAAYTDSSDYATAAQGAKADSAVQTVSITSNTLTVNATKSEGTVTVTAEIGWAEFE